MQTKGMYPRIGSSWLWFVVLGVGLVSGLVTRAQILLLPIENLVQVIPDDSFYYFQIAQNIVDGFGSTFDQLTRTNGYHPLWMACLLPIAYMVNDAITFLRVALTLGVIFDLLTATVIYGLLVRLGGYRWIAVWGALFYFLNPSITALATSGLETPLQLLLFATLLFWVLTVEPSVVNPRRYAFVGVLLIVLLFLSRTDNAFYSAFAWIIIIWRLPSSERLSIGATTVALMGVIAGPWLLWNWLTFGSPIQSSGSALTIAIRAELITDGEDPNALGFMIEKFISWLIHGLYLVQFRVSGTLFFYLLLGILWGFALFRHFVSQGILVNLAATLTFLMIALGVLFIHTSIRLSVLSWYIAEINILFVMLITFGVTLAHSLSAKLKPNLRSIQQISPQILLLVIFGVPLLFNARLARAELLERYPYPYTQQTYQASLWLNENVPADAVVGSFNTGVLQYFSEQTVTNLDGLVNFDVYQALVAGNLTPIWEKLNIDYHVDEASAFDRYRTFLDSPDQPVFIPIQEFTRTDGPALIVYEVRRAN